MTHPHLSRRGFLRALGLTTTTVVIGAPMPKLWEPGAEIRTIWTPGPEDRYRFDRMMELKWMKEQDFLRFAYQRMERLFEP